MDETGVDFAMDVHGDEAIAANFLAGFEGIPSLDQGAAGAVTTASARSSRALSPDFQTAKGYEIAAPGKANLSMSTNQLAERFGAFSMTLEMPFKDNADLPDPSQGWSPERSHLLARDCLDALFAMLDDRRAQERRLRLTLHAKHRVSMPSLVLIRHGQSALEPRKPLHRLVGRRPHREGRRGGARGRAR